MASIINIADIHLGIGVLEFGQYNDAGVFQGYDYVGAIKGTLTATVTREVRFFETGRPLLRVKNEVLREMIEIVFTMAELRVANIKMALGGGVATLSTSGATFLDGTTVAPVGDLTDSVIGVGVNDLYTAGGQCDLLTHGLRFTHLKSCNTGKRQILEIYKATSTGRLAMAFNEEDWNQWEVNFSSIADTSKAGGNQLFQFIDER
jgi:hypothetical protein